MKSRVQITKEKLNKEKLEERIKNRPRLKRRMKMLLFFAIIIIILLIVYSLFIEPYRLNINEYTINTNKNITENYNGLKIVHFSDLHYGSTIKEKELKKVVNTINKVKPDLVLFTGDLIDTRYTMNQNDISLLKTQLSKIESYLGKYAVYGNHDVDNLHFTEILNDGGFLLLENEYDLIYNKDNSPIAIYGLSDTILQKPTFKNYENDQLADIEYKIILLHEPDYINDFINTYESDLILAGHSHNGQVNPFILKPLFLPIGCKELYDTYYNINNTDIYISNGIGTSLLKIRFNSVPSINLYRLKKHN